MRTAFSTNSLHMLVTLSLFLATMIIIVPVTAAQNVSAQPLCASYNALKNVIRVTCDSTISKIAAEIDRSSVLEETSPKVWILRAILIVGPQAKLTIDSSEVDWLKITTTTSNSNGTTTPPTVNNNTHPNRIEIYGTTTINNTKITSWDERNDIEAVQLPDASIPRSYIRIREDAGTVNISNSELAFLGYEGAPKAHGLTYDEGGDGSIITNNSFHHMSYGIHPEGVGLTVNDNDFHSNIVHGISVHGAPYMLLSNNRIYNNTGPAAMVFSQNSSNLIIENNEIYNNTGHGIRFSENAHDSLLRNNTIYNQASAISINASPYNEIYGNTIKDSRYGITLQSKPREADLGILCDHCGYLGLEPPGSVNNTVGSNQIQNAEAAVRIQDNSTMNNLFEGNSLFENKNHIAIESGNNTFRNNTLGSATGYEYKVTDSAKIIMQDQLFLNDRIVSEKGTNSIIIADSGKIEIEVTNGGGDNEDNQNKTTVHNTDENSFTQMLMDGEVIILSSQ
jgi:mannuronan 5-epimerase